MGEYHPLSGELILEPREHFAGPADLPDELAREQGVMLGRVERAVLTVGGIARVHIGRWGEGAEHPVGSIGLISRDERPRATWRLTRRQPAGSVTLGDRWRRVQ